MSLEEKRNQAEYPDGSVAEYWYFEDDLKEALKELIKHIDWRHQQHKEWIKTSTLLLEIKNEIKEIFGKELLK